MSRFLNGETDRVELGDGDWVEIRRRLHYGDRRAIEEKLVRPKVADDGTVNMREVEFHMQDGNMEVLVRSVVAWGGPGFCASDDHPHEGACDPRPLSVENFSKLDETGERILAEIVRRQVRRTEAPPPGFTSARTSRTAADEPTDSSRVASPTSSSSESSSGPGTSS